MCKASLPPDRPGPRIAGEENADILAAIARSVQDGVIVINQEGVIVYWNRAAEVVFGYGADEVLGAQLDTLLIPVRFRDAYRLALNHFRLTGSATALDRKTELTVLRRDGPEFPIELSLSAFLLNDGRHLVGVVRDITLRKQEALALAGVNRALRTLSACNHALVHCNVEARLLDEICRVVVDHGGYLLAWVGYARQGADKRVDPVSQHGFEAGYLESARISWSDTELGRGPTGSAIRTGNIQINQNFLDNPSMLPWREQALKRGFRASIALPLRDGTSTFGALTIYATEAQAFSVPEVELLKELASDLAFGIVTIRTRTEHEAAREKLSFLAHYDTLTGLPNRLLLGVHIDRAIRRRKRRGSSLALLFIGLDRFQSINTSLGYGSGDDLLVEVAKRLRGVCREAHTVARWSGDEFVVLMEEVDSTVSVAELAENLIQAVNQPLRLAGSKAEVIVGASVGIAMYPADATNSTDLLRDAESAMFRAKDGDGNQFCFYTTQMNANALRMLTLETDLRQALSRDELVLYYQPKVNIVSGQVTGAEALMRWRRAGVLVSPAEFIPVAERTGLIAAMGDWAIDQVCAQMRAWLDEGGRPVTVAVNISARQFHAGDLEATVSGALSRHGIAASALELEITESSLMEQVEPAVAKLDRLRLRGVKVSLDDFGTGYSSLAYLKRFSIDYLKLDISLVKDIVTDASTAIIAVSIIALAHRMRLRVIAEGVETDAQLAYLKRQGCDEMQGYYFSKPLPAAEFAQLLASGRALPPDSMPQPGRTVLVVDHDVANLAVLQGLLQGEGYRVLTAPDALEGLRLLALNEVQVIVSDQHVPYMSGTEFLECVKDMHPDTVRIVLSEYNELGNVMRAVNDGSIYRTLTKPWDSAQLRERIREAFLYFDAVVKPRAATQEPVLRTSAPMPGRPDFPTG